MSHNALDGKIAIVTGGSSGIGKAIACRFAREGACVVVSSRNISRCEDVARQINNNGFKALAVACDVTDENQVTALFSRVNETFGHIDIVVANAGVSGGTTVIEDFALEDWNRVLNTNLTGIFLTIREAFKYMKENGGHIIVLSSYAGIEAYAGKGAYSASKFGARGIAHALGQEGRKYNINVSTICPGTVDTPILAMTNTKVKNPIDPVAIADAALFLATLRGNMLIRDLIIERMRSE